MVSVDKVDVFWIHLLGIYKVNIGPCIKGRGGRALFAGMERLRSFGLSHWVKSSAC